MQADFWEEMKSKGAPYWCTEKLVDGAVQPWEGIKIPLSPPPEAHRDVPILRFFLDIFSDEIAIGGTVQKSVRSIHLTLGIRPSSNENNQYK